MHILHFDRLVHGQAITVSDDAMTVRRDVTSCGHGVAFSAQPLRVDQKVCLELTSTVTWTGAIRIGVTSHNPSSMPISELPLFAHPTLTDKQGFWARPVSEKYATSGNRISLTLTTSGQMHYFVNYEHKGILLNHLPIYSSLWLMLDVYGNTIAAKLVSADEAPVEILARGPEAMSAYHSACLSGTRPVFRTRLMLVGQDRVGKTSLKNALTGKIHNTAEISTDGIDLSASCSFNLHDHRAWKLALAGPNSTADHNPLVYRTDTIETLDEEYQRAIATNIVLELSKKMRDDPPSPVERKDEDGDAEAVWLKGSVSEISSSGFLDSLRSHDLLQDVPESVLQLAEKIMRQREEDMANTESATNNKDVTLNIWDFAGQAAYYTLHQVFLSYRAVYVIVFNLCQDLDAVAKTQLLQPASSQGENQELELTNLGYMDYWMNLIHTHTAQNCRSRPADGSLSPPIFIVGTHRASLADTRDEQDRLAAGKFERIKRFISSRPYEKHIVPRFYAVDNSLGPADDVTFSELQRDIEDVASLESYMGEQIPSRWLRFEQQINMLVELGCYFTSVEQMHEVACESGVSSLAEFRTLLQFYHDLGVIVHYGGQGTLDTQLRHTVILSPQWLIDMFKRIICPHELDLNDEHSDLWQRLANCGILEERLVNLIWKDEHDEKPALLGLMQKFDLIYERISTRNISMKVREGHGGDRSYYIPCCLCNNVPSKKLYTPTKQDVVFYLDFNGFLPDGLFHRVLTRAIRWSQECRGHEPQLFYRKAKFFLDSEHDYVLEMAPSRLARIKVSVLRVVDLEETDDANTDSDDEHPMPPPNPTACAKVRRFLESSLSELREMWMKRIHFKATVQCPCDKECSQHSSARCQDPDCIHFLFLDECLSNKVVCCEHRRIKTAPFRKWFPNIVEIGKPSPAMIDCGIQHEKYLGVVEKEPQQAWMKSAAKLLNGGAEGQDWSALAKLLGYKKNKIEKFNNDLNPGLALLTDWTVTSGNTSLSVDMLISYLKQMYREDIVDIILRGQVFDADPPQVFISYQWDSQDEVKVLRDRLEKAGVTCWMDIGQMGGGDQLYARVDEGIRQAKVVVACVTPKFVVSHYCNREVSLADLLGKPVIPVLYEQMAWPPPGGMALIFSQLVYINMKGIGGHGGCGIHADLESKYEEVIGRVSAHVTPKAHKPYSVTSSIDYFKKLDRMSDTSPGSPEHRTPPPSQNPYIITTYNPNPVLSLQRHSTSGDGLRLPARNTEQNTPPDYSNTVEQVHVTKCAVCNIL